MPLIMLSCSSGCTPVSASQALYIPGYNPTLPAGLSMSKLAITHLPLSPLYSRSSQGCVLGPLLFSIYTSSISTIAQSQLVSQQQYADDTQLPSLLDVIKDILLSVSLLQLPTMPEYLCPRALILLIPRRYVNHLLTYLLTYLLTLCDVYQWKLGDYECYLGNRWCLKYLKL